jgi:tRNA pseudouridine55 synthase
MDGVLIIDKPAGMTSHDVVHRVRLITGERSVGHLGTLDPMATGVLPLVLGRMTRLAQFYAGAEKSYEGEIRFGFATDTYDAAGEMAGAKSEVELRLEDLRAAAGEFVGVIEQMPPPFSAKKIAGVPAYKLARRKQPVELKPVKVEIKEFEILGIEADRAAFRARVASGTYLRSVAHELGDKLGTGAHLASLRRTAVGEFSLEMAVTLERLEGLRTELRDSQCPITDIMLNNGTRPLFLHPRLLLPQFPSVSAPPETLAKILHGNAANLPEFSNARLVKVFRGQAELLAIAQRVAGTLFHPKVVIGS